MQTYIRPSVARGASALMECAGWFLNNAASSKLVIHARFDQPRSYLSCHQRSIAKATCAGNLFCSAVFGRQSELRRRCRHMTRLVGLARRQQRPREPRVLVGHCNGRDVVMSATDQLAPPRPGPVGSCLGELHQRSATVNQQGSQVNVASLADAQQLRLAVAGVLMRYQPHPCGELPRVLEVARVAGAGHQSARGEGPIPGMVSSRWLTSLARCHCSISRSSSWTC